MMRVSVLSLCLMVVVTVASSNGQYIWDWLTATGSFTPQAVAGIMGNLYKESGYNPKNLQNSFESKLGYTDATYTAAVDSGTYTKQQFVHDSAGYGLAQWTFWTRKQALYEYLIEQKKVSIGDIQGQMEFLYSETYVKSWFDHYRALKNICEASTYWLFNFENPADKGQTEQKVRCNYGINAYNSFSAGGETPIDPPTPPTPATSGMMFYILINTDEGEATYIGTQKGNWIYFNDVNHYRMNNRGNRVQIYTGVANWKEYSGFSAASIQLIAINARIIESDDGDIASVTYDVFKS